MLDRLVTGLRDCPPVPEQPSAAQRHAAVLMALTRQRDPELVLIRRARHLRSHAGQVAFPGGMWEHGDESLLHTALRESEEEVGLPGEAVELVARLPGRTTRLGVPVTPYLGLIEPHLELKHDPGEVDSVFRVPLSFLLDERHLSARPVQVLGECCELPAYLYKGYIIWGFTLVVLVDFLNRVFGKDMNVAVEPGALPLAIRQKYPNFPEA